MPPPPSGPSLPPSSPFPERWPFRVSLLDTSSWGRPCPAILGGSVLVGTSPADLGSFPSWLSADCSPSAGPPPPLSKPWSRETGHCGHWLVPLRTLRHHVRLWVHRCGIRGFILLKPGHRDAPQPPPWWGCHLPVPGHTPAVPSNLSSSPRPLCRFLAKPNPPSPRSPHGVWAPLATRLFLPRKPN